ncbi:mitochondrial pyruvate dehydrogenase (lipoamide) phosphatase [Schizosaccharomyces osmophilus]|uniref:Mitochondrial pyruvate dehydrogenase (Lipoamide) phosphatase n=1 Tax=Schizosaccharomyces osmophilus TaxID=2545709 RepID=A0AAE9WBN3_9SCHI|nr:mitochondrial pyruvate dehydrogenase (lipoamide) phosphatase [Schizosaccharomyces osmophilus]WBW72669.1 mitochondrial pyruvate dehydrogenase (lipoamide) phosphatase [Schizosaccharomyces osmophilus]
MGYFTSKSARGISYLKQVSITTAIVSSIGYAAYHLREQNAVQLDPPNTTYSNPSKVRLPPKDPESINSRLREYEKTVFVNRDGIARYDFNQLASNDPCEDDHVESVSKEIDDGNWYFWGVFDGHSGWNTSLYLRQHLVPAVVDELRKTAMTAMKNNACPSALSYERSLCNAFENLDNHIVHENISTVFKNPKSVQNAARLLLPAVSGSCALLTAYSAKSKTLQVACTGDSRAVLGEQTSSGSWNAVPLSRDQTGANPDEAARLEVEHPGETVLRNNRILGRLMPSRAFGDARFKWSRQVSERLHKEYFSAVPIPVKSPPYVTAVPEVETVRVDSKKHKFLIMASDGLWDTMSSERAVELVGQWMNSDFGKKPASENFSSSTLNLFNWFHKASPVVDENAATHLVRNALGGKDETISALLTLTYPLSRRYRDDLTVTVVFFEENEAA